MSTTGTARRYRRNGSGQGEAGGDIVGDIAATSQPDPVTLLLDAVGQLSHDDGRLVYEWLLRHLGGPPVATFQMAAMYERGETQLRAFLEAPPSTETQMVPVRLPVDQHAQLRDWCRAHGFSMATVIRGLLTDFLARQHGIAQRQEGEVASTEAAGTVPDESPVQPGRSGAEVEEAVETAAAGTQHGGVERPPEEAVSGDSPVERTRGDATMTGGQGPAEPRDTEPR